MDMTGRRVMVSGASSGLGRATAILLSELGAQLVLVARNRDRLEQTRSQLSGEGHHIIERDLGTDIDAIPKWMKQVVETTGPLHGLVHSAGIVALLPLRGLSYGKLHELMDINFSSAVMLTRGFRQRGVVEGGGSIALLSSVAGLIGQRGLSAYCASKGALMALTRSLALELAEENIRINCVAPGLVETEMVNTQETDLLEDKLALLTQCHPLGLGRPADVANAVCFLLADTGRWITGTSLVVDGGYMANGML
jgi:NAD(P)-dependent dehydrogenase (short-subunit alcohol dehydrogenase family)